ncbi:MAG: helicase-associated domain-containing protein, partial [Anaerolineales bacterium]|nr:helicase-associated domain-containing protein [Anaerolineales bacterium]
MQYNPQNPIIVQGDKSVLLEVNNALYQEARDILSRFAELEKSPEYIHTYRISPLSLWNAASTGLDAETIVAGLSRYSKYPLPGNVEVDIREYVGRYGRIRLLRRDNDLLLTSHDIPLIIELQRRKELKPYILNPEDAQTLRVDPAKRGHIKQALVNIGYPAEDLAGYVSGDSVNFDLRLLAQSGSPFALRHYQQEAGEIFYADGEARGGSGVIVLPCGAGKTIVGLSVMNEMQCSTLILTPNTVSVRQWIDELLDKTTLTPEQVGEYSGQRKEIRPITISTY